MAAEESLKKVLVLYGENTRCITFKPDDEMSSERLKEEIFKTYSDFLNGNEKIFIQLKDEDWGGHFVDYFGDAIADRSVIRVIVSKPQNVSVLKCASIRI